MSSSAEEKRNLSKRNREQGTGEEKTISHLALMNLVPGSGCGSIDKEDLISRGHLGQVKSTRGDRISVSIKDLVLLDERAKENTKRMVFFLSFVKKNKRYAIIDLEEWIRMNR